MRRALYLLPVLLFAVLAGWFGLALRPGYDPHAIPSQLIDQPMPRFSLAGADGPLASESFAGHVVLVNFFASWCIPCRAEHPMLMRLAEQEHATIYGIAWKDKAEDARRFIAQLGDPYRAIGFDESGRVGIEFGLTGVPESFLIDKAGHIRRHYGAPISPEQLNDDLLPLLHQLMRS